MGTRSLTFVYDGDEPIVNMYRQFDGYPSGHGKELAEFLSKIRLVNGVSSGNTNTDESIKANGIGCLAAFMIVHFKEDSGGIYLEAPNLNDDHGEDYRYHVDEYGVRVEDCSKKTLFDGTWSEFLAYCNSTED